MCSARMSKTSEALKNVLRAATRPTATASCYRFATINTHHNVLTLVSRLFPDINIYQGSVLIR